MYTKSLWTLGSSYKTPSLRSLVITSLLVIDTLSLVTSYLQSTQSLVALAYVE